jgi:2-methylisocitrate lyase-like PEP mutase family enzyme
MTAFADLHRPGAPLILPNAWDHASGAALAAAGFGAIGTTSLGVAAAIGTPDGHDGTAEATLQLAHRLAHLSAAITVDIEHGFSDDPEQVAGYVARLPAAGVNIEDGLGDPALHAAKVACIKARAPGLFVNVRTDTYWLGRPSLDETLERASAYVEAGADGIFVPGVTAEDEIATLAREVPVPLNVLFAPGTLAIPELAALGVARVSTGSLLFRVALGAALEAATAVRDGSRLDELDAPSYSQVDQLAVLDRAQP